MTVITLTGVWTPERIDEVATVRPEHTQLLPPPPSDSLCLHEEAVGCVKSPVRRDLGVKISFSFLGYYGGCQILAQKSINIHLTFFCFVFWRQGFTTYHRLCLNLLYRSGWHWILAPFASASPVLGLQVSVTTFVPCLFLNKINRKISWARRLISLKEGIV